MIIDKVKDLELIITFNSNYTKQGISDLLTVLDVEVLLELDEFNYVIKLDPYDYSTLSRLNTVSTNLISRPLNYD